MGNLDLMYIAFWFCNLIFLLIGRYIKTNKYIYPIIYICAVAFFSANRNLNIPDTKSYIYIFESLTGNLLNLFDLNYFETGFIFLSWVIKSITNSYKVYFFILTFISLLQIFIASNFLNKYLFFRNNSLTALVLFVSTFGYTLIFITVRAGLAFSFLFLGYCAYHAGKKIYFLINIILAVLMHTSAIIPIVLVITIIQFPFFSQFKNEKGSLLWIVTFFIAFFLGSTFDLYSLFIFIGNNISFIKNRFFAYLTPDIVGSSDVSFRFLIYICILLFVNSRNNNIIYSQIISIFCVSCTLYLLFKDILIIGRVVEFSITPIFVNIAHNQKVIPKNILKYLLFLIILVYFSISNYRISF